MAKYRISRAERLGCLEKGCSVNGADLFWIFRTVLSSTGEGEDGTAFGLTNGDLGPHNLLVDSHFKVTAMIDLDFVHAAPLYSVARHPLKTHSELDVKSSNLGVAKRTREYQKALDDLGHCEFKAYHESSFGKFWAELEEQDVWAMKKPIDMNIVRAFMESKFK